ncbi:MAG: transglutaminase-like domain-containing protein, partial [Victivallales bacterium]|nr:transglutaminase-like domain-containing protein [Victivallales bacterium]
VSSKLVSKVLFLPGDFRRIDIIAGMVKYSENGNVSFQDWITDGGYTAYHSQATADSAWPLPAAPGSVIYTRVPAELHQALDAVLAALPQLHGNGKLKDRGRIFALLQYFQNNFKYKIRAQSPNSTDPVMDFLRNTREGHCELFASAMVLLLRRQGIPARYVTGFVCTEKHPLLAYYVARLGNAHAWVEAFDRDLRQWQLLEPTPPEGIDDCRHDWSVLESWSDMFKKTFQQLLSNLRRGYFALAIIEFFTTLWQLLLLLCLHPVRGPLAGLLLLLPAYYYLRRRRRKHQPPPDYAGPDEALRELGLTFRKIRRRLQTEYELELPQTATINEFITALSSSAMPEKTKDRTIPLLREYEAMRYRRPLPPAELINDLRKRLAGWKL